MTITHTGIKRLLTKLNTKITTLLNGKANTNHTHSNFITNPFSLTSGVETSLGDGTYIQRFTGSVTVPSSGSTTVSLKSSMVPSTFNMIEWGGMMTISSSGTKIPVPFTNPSTGFSIIPRSTTDNGLHLYVLNNTTLALSYNVWIRYIKI